MDSVVLDDIINRLLEVRGSRPDKQVQLSEAEIRQLCITSKDIFMGQPNLLELEVPIKICGMRTNLLKSKGPIQNPLDIEKTRKPLYMTHPMVKFAWTTVASIDTAGGEPYVMCFLEFTDAKCALTAISALKECLWNIWHPSSMHDKLDSMLLNY